MEQRKLPCPNEGLSSSNYKSMFIWYQVIFFWITINLAFIEVKH
jgi:hypothetical protein